MRLLKLQGVAVLALSVALLTGCENATPGTGGSGGDGGGGGTGGGNEDCGNDTLDTGEQCDGSDLNGQDCATVGAAYGGDLACDTCMFDYAGCNFSPICGDGAADGGEQCDDTDLRGETCASGGYTGGDLACDNLCKYDTSSCTGTGPVCGDGSVTGLEDCDGSDLDGASCTNLGFGGGTLACDACAFDTSGCEAINPPECGNGVVEGGEDCDGSALGGNSCSDVGAFGGGELACNSGCVFDTSGCEAATCTDGVQNQDETDDDCGGDTCGACLIGESCLDHNDCDGELTCSITNVCVEHCDDGRETGDETDVDCGGLDCVGCALGDACGTEDDCEGDLSCVSHVCSDPCSDGVQNNLETGVDCGGGTCCACDEDAGCVNDDDCNGRLTCLDGGSGDVCTDSCVDGVMNHNESDIDCGGDICALCGLGDDCGGDTDCAAGLDCLGNLCADECTDTTMNNDETDVDCGGGTCLRCDLTDDCLVDEDCFSDFCDAGACALRADQMGLVEICALYINLDTYGGSICHGDHHPSILDLDSRQIAVDCRPGTDAYSWAADLTDSYNNGRITIDWDMAHRCQANSRYLRATYDNYLLADASQSPGIEWAALVDESTGDCHNFYQANSNLGDPCKEDWDCAEPTYCGSPDSFTPATCLAGSVDGEACGGFLQCADGFLCDTDVCEPGLADGQGCSFSEDCASGYCDPGTATCAVAPVPLALGAQCVSADECDGDCVTCRPLLELGDEVCALPAGETDYCRDNADCVPGLVCVDGLCDRLGRNDPCSDKYTVGGQCGADYICLNDADIVQGCWAFDGDAAGCAGSTLACGGPPLCMFDDYYQYCDPIDTKCIELPESGPCAGGAYCATDYYCDTGLGARGECVPFPSSGPCAFLNDNYYCAEGYFCNLQTECEILVEPGQPCVDGEDLCSGNYQCVGGSCVFECVSSTECGMGEICDFETSTCIPARLQCLTDDECASDEFCLDPFSACTVLQGDAAACAANLDCALIPGFACLRDTYDCAQHDADQTNCEATGICLYGACQTVNCGDLGDATACGATTFCVWDAAFSTCSEVNCIAFDGDQAACEATGVCGYDPGTGWCDPLGAPTCDTYGSDLAACGADADCVALTDCYSDPTIDCSVHDGDGAACGAEPGCVVLDMCADVWNYCGFYSGDQATCDANPDCQFQFNDPTMGCLEDDQYCWQYDAIGQAACEGDPLCYWDASTGCWNDAVDDCVAFDGDATACLANAWCFMDVQCASALDFCPMLDGDSAGCAAEPACTYRPDLCLRTVIDCSDYDGNQVACEGTGECLYNTGNGFCEPDGAIDPTCAAFDGDATGCAAEAGCEVVDQCVETGDGCYNAADQTACTALAPDCGWDAALAGGLGRCVEMTNTCTRNYDSGDQCSPFLDGADCVSGFCSLDADTNTFKCETDIGDGCNADVGFLRNAFLFGLVFAVGRGGLRWRRRRRKDKK